MLMIYVWEVITHG